MALSLSLLGLSLEETEAKGKALVARKAFAKGLLCPSCIVAAGV